MLEISGDQPAVDQEGARRKDIFTMAGSIAGIVALCWNIYWTTSNAHSEYVQLTLDVSASKPITVVTTIENKSVLAKNVEYAALIISPADSDLRMVVRELNRCTGSAMTYVNFESEPLSNLLGYLPSPDKAAFCDGDISILPLPFFYKEQVRVENEILRSRTFIDTNLFHHDPQQNTLRYDVRFVVRGGDHNRSTQDLLIP